MPNSFATGVLGQLMYSAIPATISEGERTLLRRLLGEDAKDGDESEQLTRFVPGGWWLGADQISAPLCFRLLRHCFISMDGEESGGVSYWRVNDMGRMASEGMRLDEINAAVR